MPTTGEASWAPFVAKSNLRNSHGNHSIKRQQSYIYSPLLVGIAGCWGAVFDAALNSIRMSVLGSAHAPTWQLRTSSQNNDLRAKRAARNADWAAMSLMVLYITHVDPAIEFENKMCGSRVVCAALIWATLQPPPSLQRCCNFCTGVTGSYKFN